MCSNCDDFNPSPGDAIMVHHETTSAPGVVLFVDEDRMIVKVFWPFAEDEKVELPTLTGFKASEVLGTPKFTSELQAISWSIS